MSTQQLRRHSALEAFLNVAIGLIVSVCMNAIILPAYGMPFRWASFGSIAVWFTLVSVIRSYWTRRLFVWLHDKGVLR